MADRAILTLLLLALSGALVGCPFFTRRSDRPTEADPAGAAPAAPAAPAGH
jgi:hypothetical protein